MDWNPGRPDLVGLEYPVRNYGALPRYSVTSPSQGVAQRLASTVTQTVDLMGLPILGQAATTYALIETLIAGSEDPGVITTTAYAPNVVVNGGTAWRNEAGSTVAANLLASIDDVTLNTTDYVEPVSVAQGTTGALELEFATATVGSGDRIVGMRLQIVATEVGGTGPGTGTLSIAGAGTPWRSGKLINSSNATVPTSLIVNTGEINPATIQPWTAAEIQSIDTSALRVQLTWTKPWWLSFSNTRVRIFQVVLLVDTCAENRKTTQVVTVNNSGPRWQTWTPRTPTGGANLAKVNGQALTVLARQPRFGDLNPGASVSSLAFSIPYFLGFRDVPVAGLESYGLVPLNNAAPVPSALVDYPDRMFGVELRISGTQSVDAEQYATVVAVQVTGTVQQEISAAALDTYAGLAFPLRYVGSNPGTLTARLRRRSDNVTMGTATYTRDEWDAALADPVVGSWKLVQALFAAPTLLATATQYYVDFTVAGATGGAYWQVQALTGGSEVGTGSVTGVAGYGGTTDVATYGGGDVTNADIVVGTFLSPDPPTGFVASEFTDPLTLFGRTGIEGIGGVLLDWNAAVGSFSFYEVQRRDAYTDWQTIARITDQTVDFMRDYEGLRGLESCYRVRLADAQGVRSEWAAESCATRPVAGCGYTFTTNEAPELNVGYVDVYGKGREGATRSYEWPNEVEFHRMYLRNFQVAEMPLEEIGTTFTRQLLVHGFQAPASPGERAFQPLRSMSRAALSYVCVTDDKGNRWLANVQVPTGDEQSFGGDGQAYYAPVVVTQTTDTSSVVDYVAP